MLQTYERPYRPIEIDDGLVKSFPLFAMVEQLRGEEVYLRTGRDALTLIRGQSLTVVLTVARKGTSCDEHHVPHDALIIALDGWITVSSPAATHPWACIRAQSLRWPPMFRRRSRRKRTRLSSTVLSC